MTLQNIPFQSHLFSLNNDHLERHKNLSICIVFGRGGPVRLTLDDQLIEGGIILIENNLQHELFFAPGGWHALYLDGLALKTGTPSAMQLDDRKWAALPEEFLCGSTQLIQELRESLDARHYPVSPDIAEIVGELYADPMHRLSQQLLATRLGLERTQAMRFFKDQTGMTFRNFKLWSALMHAAKSVINGTPIGLAAHDAGFSDAAHLARTSKNLFGMTPTLGSQSVTRMKDS